MARAEFVKHEEQVITVRETAAANRLKEIQLIKAREGAEQSAIEVVVKADAEKKAALDRAEAQLTESRAQAERIRLVAEADQKRFEVAAFGEKTINEAKNLLSSEIIQFELRKAIAELAPQIVAAMVKPMENIESIKVIQANGFGGFGGAAGGGGEAGASGGADANLPNQLVRAALGYRMNMPLIEKLLEEIGLRADSPNGMLDALTRASVAGNGKHDVPAETNVASPAD